MHEQAWLILACRLNKSWKNFDDIHFVLVKFPDFSQFRVKIPWLFRISQNSLTFPGFQKFQVCWPPWYKNDVMKVKYLCSWAGEGEYMRGEQLIRLPKVTWSRKVHKKNRSRYLSEKGVHIFNWNLELNYSATYKFLSLRRMNREKS